VPKIERAAVAISLPRAGSHETVFEEQMGIADEGIPKINLSLQKINEFDASSYQSLLSNMVSVMSSDAVSHHDGTHEKSQESRNRQASAKDS